LSNDLIRLEREEPSINSNRSERELCGPGKVERASKRKYITYKNCKETISIPSQKKKQKKEKCFAIPIRNNAMMETESKMTTTTVVVWEGMARQNNKTYV